MITLTELQTDAVCELLNVGMGQATKSLSEMVGEEVLLAVPSAVVVTRRLAIDRIRQVAGDPVTAVSESFSGPFSGEAILIFPEKQSLRLVQAMLGFGDLPIENLSEMEQEALVELGNIVLNACLSSLANIFSQEMHCEVPVFVQGPCEVVLDDHETADQEDMLLWQMDFSLERLNIEGYLTLLMDVESVEEFSARIQQWLGEVI